MAHPYTTAADNPHLRTLTDAGIAHLRKLNERDEKELELLRAERARHQAEINSIDDVMTDLYDTIGRRQAKMRGDFISQMPVAAPGNGQGDPLAHTALFQGSEVIEPTRVQTPGAFAETKPDGFCIHCGEPVWRVSISPASPKGFRHSYGATCNPDDPNSGVAELDERQVES